MSWDESLFSWAYQRISNFQKKVETRVPESWISELEILSSSLWGRRVVVKLNNLEMGYYDDLLIIPESFPGLVQLEKLKRFLLYSICFQSILKEEFLSSTGVSSDFFAQLQSQVIDKFPSCLNIFQEIMTEYPNLKDYFLSDKANKESLLVDKIWYPRKPRIDQQRIKSKYLGLTETNNLNKSKNSIKVKTAIRPKQVQINEKQESPLVHVFEKVLTLENYQGGDRQMDDAGDLIEQGNALNEVGLNQMTRSQERVSGLIQSDVVIESSEVADIDHPVHFSEINKWYEYPEWSHSKNCYLKNWVRLEEATQEESDEEYKILFSKRSHEFDSLMNSPLWIRSQVSGNEIDLPAAVNWFSSPQEIRDPEPKAFMKKKSLDPNFSFLILLDQSYSTDGWLGEVKILDLLKKSLLGLVQHLSEYEENYAVASFYSQTRRHVSFNYLKHFNESKVKLEKRIPLVQPKYYTRIGAVLRHSIEALKENESSRKFILLLSDCKPTDYDRYEGTHGFEDVKKAIQDLESQGITCLVFSTQSQSIAWLSDLFQSSQFRVFSSPQDFLDQFFDLFWLRVL